MILVADEAFSPDEIGTRYVRLCTRCSRPYGAGDYSEHADRYHNEGRTRYWRLRDRLRRAGATGEGVGAASPLNASGDER